MVLPLSLKIDWCSHAAAKYAVEHWHYSGCLPVGKMVKMGVWEDDKFIGAVIFSWGANPNLSKPYGLKMIEVAELVRVALNDHKAPVTKIVSICLKMLKKQSPGIKLVISFADAYHDHVGVIYQAGNWLYLGKTHEKNDFELNGKIINRRAYTGKGFGGKRLPIPPGAKKIKMPPKYRYAMPLDIDVREKILQLSQPYPKRVGSIDDDATPLQEERAV